MGEHTIGTDPDCEETQAGAKFCAPKIIKRKVAKSILHEDWNPKTIENDIALLRLKDISTWTFQPQASTPDLSTTDFSTMNFLTPDLSTMNFRTMG